MNVATRPERAAAALVAVEIAGEAALLDPRGALLLPSLGLLVVSDLHLEKGAAYARRGAMLPPYDTAATLALLGAVIADHRPAAVVSLGDSFHDARGSAEMPAVYRDEVARLAAGRDWFWIAGNHDRDPPHGLPGEAVAELAVGAVLFRHEPSRSAPPGEIAGHLHPGARIVRRGRAVRRACFAHDGNRMVMPAFGAYTGTMNVLDRACAALFDWENFTAFMLGAGRLYPMRRAKLV